MGDSDVPRTTAPGKAHCVTDILAFLRSLAPLELAESWDNVGLLWGDDSQRVTRLMTCLTLTDDVALEAAERGAELIVSHHPVLFRPVQRVTSQTPEGRTLLRLARESISVVSMHTAYDSANEGINHQLALTLGLQNVTPLRPRTSADTDAAGHGQGAGRMGTLRKRIRLAEFIREIKSRLGLAAVDFVGGPEVEVERVAIACGSAADFLPDALEQRCQLLVTGEARFHACVLARALGLAMILIGHFESERPAMIELAGRLGRAFPSLDVWASAVETNPIHRG